MMQLHSSNTISCIDYSIWHCRPRSIGMGMGMGIGIGIGIGIVIGIGIGMGIVRQSVSHTPSKVR